MSAESQVPISAVYYRASELIKSGWTQFYYARTRNDIRVNPLHEEAAKWCYTGSLIKSCADLDFDFSNLPRYYNKYNPDWNDAPERTQEEVLGVLLEIAAMHSIEEEYTNPC